MPLRLQGSSTAALSATFARAWHPATAVLLGCSLTAQDTVGGPTYVDTAINAGTTGDSFQGYMTWASTLLDHRLKVIRNAGIGGQTTSQVLARVQADVIAYSPGWCIVEGGIVNSVSGGMSYAQIVSDLTSMYSQLRAAGIRVVACTGTPTTYASTTAMRQTLRRVNNWVRKHARLNGLPVCDWAPVVQDPANGAPFAAWFRTEGDSGQVHPNAIGASRMGRVLANTLEPLIPRTSHLPESNDPDNLLLNGRLTGTTGTNGVGAGVTGTVPTSWTVYSGSGTTPAVTLSQPARSGLAPSSNRPDAALLPGGVFQMAATTGNASEFHLYQQAMTGFAVGDLVVAEIEFGMLNDWTGGVQPPYIQLIFNGGPAGSHNTFYKSGSDAGWADSAALTGVLRTKPIVVPAGTTGIRYNAGFKTTTGTVWFDRAGLYNLTAMGLTDY